MTLDRALGMAVVALTEGDHGYPHGLALDAALALENLRSTLNTGRPLSQRTREQRVRVRYSTT